VNELERVARLPAARNPISVALLTTAFGQSPGLAVVTQTSSELHVWRELDGEPTILATQDSPTSVRLADWTQDGEPDFALPGFNTESISFFHGVDGVAAGAMSLAITGRPTVVRALNLDGDLRNDLAILRVLEQRITVLLAREPGVFDPLDIGESFPAQPNGMAVFDLGDDESPDFAAGNTFGDEIWILRSSVNYAREAIPLGGSGPSAIHAGDLDHDGIEDLASSLFISDQVSVHFGVGPGALAPPVTADVGRGPVALAIGDFDGNGFDDLATANNDETTLSVVTQGPARTLTARPPIPFQVGFPGGLATGHLDADEHLDLAVGGFFGLELFSGDGTGGFTSVRFIETAAEFAAMRIADLDEDGIDELIAADRVGNAMVILPGATDAERAEGVAVVYPPLSFGVAHVPSDFEILELDADGRLDLAVVSSPGGTLTLLFTGGAVVGVDLPAPVSSVDSRVQLTANPFRERAAFLVDLARPAAADLRIYDVSGRLVAAPFAGRLTAGRSELVWEGRDASGGRAPKGIYFYRLHLGERIVRGKLVRF
jgi:hypothetical protein